MTPQRLFVYGTLGPDGPNRSVLARIGGRWIPAAARGRLESAGWGAGMGYPALVLDLEEDPVPGHVFVSPDLAAHWDELDAFEGQEYERVRTSVLLRDGDEEVEAFVYVLRQ